VLSLQTISTQSPPPTGYYVSKFKLINDETVEPDKEEKEEEKKGRDSPVFRNDKYDFDPSGLPSLGNISLTKNKPSVRLTNDVAVRIPTLRVDTGSSELAVVSFGESQHGDQGLYIDNLIISFSSYLEFDVSKATLPSNSYVFTRADFSSITHRIGFLFPDGRRWTAKSSYWGEGWYRISVDKQKQWHPPMVPEPTTYGAGLMGMGLAVVGYRFYLRRRQAGRINRVIRLSHF